MDANHCQNLVQNDGEIVDLLNEEDDKYEGGAETDEICDLTEDHSSQDGDVSTALDESMSEYLTSQRSMTETEDKSSRRSANRRTNGRSAEIGCEEEDVSEIDHPSNLFDKFEEETYGGVDGYTDCDNQADMEQELEFLKTRNKELEDQVRLMTQFLCLDNFLPDEMNAPVALVVVPDNPLARYYKDKIEEFLSNLPPITESKLRREKKTDEYRPMYQHASFNLYSLLKHSDPRSSKFKMLYNSFVALGDYLVDACGQPLVNFEPSLTDGWIIPAFSQPWKFTIGDPDKPSESKKFQMSCFNCGGPHNLRECVEKRDLVRISQNRLALLERFGAAPGLAAKSTRYHLEVSEVDKRFAKFTPGRISQELREAMGLSRRSLPMFVYKMRQLGYPPGWLIEAELESSGLDIIHDKEQLVEDGEVVCMDDKSDPLGKTAGADKQKEVTYNMDKLVAYPGFNTKIPEGTRDECNRMRPAMPPMQKHQQLAAWNRYLSKDIPQSDLQNNQKRTLEGYEEEHRAMNGSLNSSKRIRLDGTLNNTTDMDICEDEPVMPIIQPSEEERFRGFVPPPPDSPAPEDVREPMPEPVKITSWWLSALRVFVNDLDSASLRSKRSHRRKERTGIVLNEEGEIVEDDHELDEENGDEISIRFNSVDDTDAVTCASTVEDTIRTLREEKSIAEPLDSNSKQTEEMQTDENLSDEVKEHPFKVTPEQLQQMWHFCEQIPPTDPHMFLFPDRNEPEVMEELFRNPPQECEDIQLGEVSSRYRSAKGLPEYWKFGQGIEPYEAKEEVPILGLYSRILNTLKQHNKSFR